MSATIDPNALARLFDLAGFEFDVEAGVVRNPNANRDLYVSTDLARGIYEALVEETGPAWKLLLYTCGQRTGQRIGKRLDKDVRAVTGIPLAELGVEPFREFIEQFFTATGWGVLRVDFSQTSEKGVVEVSLENSFFADALFDVDDYVDALLAGMLAGLMSTLAGTELACIEAGSPRMGHERTSFLVSSPARIEKAQLLRDEGLGPDRIRESLLR